MAVTRVELAGRSYEVRVSPGLIALTVMPRLASAEAKRKQRAWNCA